MSEPKFKAGDLAFSFENGFLTIKDAKHLNDKVVGKITHGPCFYHYDGRLFSADLHPSLLTVEEAAKLGYFPTKAKKKIKLREAIFKDKYGYWVFLIDEGMAEQRFYGCDFVKWIEGGRELEVDDE